jgi:hypothetical protein
MYIKYIILMLYYTRKSPLASVGNVSPDEAIAAFVEERLACPPKRSSHLGDDVLAVPIALDKRVQTQFRV